MAIASIASVTGIILAGGLARRMGGGDKCFLPLGSKTLLEHTIERARPQVSNLLINVNGDAQRFASTGIPVVPDEFTGNLGPLAGIHSGLKWLQANTRQSWLASFACDTPFFPSDLVQVLFQQSSMTHIVVARSGEETQSVFALWHLSLLDKLTEQLQGGKIPRTQDWIAQQNPVYVEFSCSPYDPFFNINTPSDLHTAELIQGQI